MREVLALLPIALFVLLLTGLHLSAAKAGLASAAIGLVVALLAFDYPLGAVSLAGPFAEALFTSATILWIIFPALGIYEFQTRTGASDTIGRWLASISPKPQVEALLLAWFFAMFLEGAAGFGTPIALTAPLLVAFGFPPVKALVLALFGHAAGVSFGAVGTPIVPLREVGVTDPRELSLVIALLHATLGGFLALLVFRIARPAEQAERASSLWVPAAAIAFFVPAVALAWFAGPELPTLGGALLGALAFTALARWQFSREGPPPVAWRAIAAAALPYLVVLVLILATRLIGPLTEVLREVALSWSIGERFEGTVAPLYHPGTMLMLALLVSALPKGRGTALGPALQGAAARLPPVALALVAVLLLARLMVHSGMIDALALAAAGLMPGNWLLVAPLLGALGSFVTGSATTSNIILAEFHAAAAAATGLAPLLPLAGQGFGSAIGNIIAPHNIVAGAATVGLVGREGEVLKRTFPVCLAYALAGGAILLVVSRTF